MAETEAASEKIHTAYSKDEIVDISKDSKQLLCRMEVMKKDVYRPELGPGTQAKVYRRTTSARSLISQQVGTH